jgi:hypothetical protein
MLVVVDIGPLYAVAQFLRSLTRMDVEGPTADDWPRIADLATQYGDFRRPMTGTLAAFGVEDYSRLQSNCFEGMNDTRLTVYFEVVVREAGHSGPRRR